MTALSTPAASPVQALLANGAASNAAAVWLRDTVTCVLRQSATSTVIDCSVKVAVEVPTPVGMLLAEPWSMMVSSVHVVPVKGSPATMGSEVMCTVSLPLVRVRACSPTSTVGPEVKNCAHHCSCSM